MAGLIFLWQNNEGTVAPSVNTDYGLQPSIYEILNKGPTLFVDSTDAVFGTTNTLVNDTVFLVNDSNSIVGGGDNQTWLGPNLYEVGNIKPVLVVSKTNAQFSNESALVNDTVFIVNDPDTTVGGRDIFSWKPEFFGIIDSIKPELFKVGNL